MSAKPAPVEQALVKHLETVLGEEVATRVPSTRPDRFVKLTRTGGSHYELVLSKPTVLFECWGKTDSDAWQMVSMCWSAVRDLARVSLPTIYVNDISLTDPVNYPDSASGSPRYQFIATLTVALTEENL